MYPQLNHMLAQEHIAELHRAGRRERLATEAATARRTSREWDSSTRLGVRLVLRPLGAGDRAGLAALFARLTPESRYRRFLSPKRELTPRELAYFTDIDHRDHEAFAAVDRRDGSIVGVGRYIHEADRAGVAAVAVEVVDELQGIGIGTELATHTVRRARVNGFGLLTATTLWANRPARALLRRLGFHARRSDGAVVDFELELNPNTTTKGGAQCRSSTSS